MRPEASYTLVSFRRAGKNIIYVSFASIFSSPFSPFLQIIWKHHKTAFWPKLKHYKSPVRISCISLAEHTWYRWIFVFSWFLRVDGVFLLRVPSPSPDQLCEHEDELWLAYCSVHFLGLSATDRSAV